MTIEQDARCVESSGASALLKGCGADLPKNGEELMSRSPLQRRWKPKMASSVASANAARSDASKARVGVKRYRSPGGVCCRAICVSLHRESRWCFRDNPLVIRGPGAGRDVKVSPPATRSDYHRLAAAAASDYQ